MEHQQWEQVVWSSGDKRQHIENKKVDSKKTKEMKTNEQLADATDALALKKISKSLSQQIIEGRTAKKMKRSDLARAINEKESIIADYENNKAVVNQQIINKISRVLGIKLKK